MSAMQVVGSGHQLSSHASVQREPSEYVIVLDVSEFGVDELSLETLGSTVTVRGDQRAFPGDDGKPFRMHERLEESFRLPDDADVVHLAATFDHGSITIRAPRLHVEPRTVRIERARQALINPDAEAC